VESIPDESVLGSSRAGSLVRELAGDIFITDGADSVRLTTGELIAIGVDEAIVHECDTDLLCDVVRVDLVTGERRTAETASLGPLVVGATARREVALEGSLSPDGRTALVELAPGRDDGPGWAFADLITDGLVPIDTPDDHQPIVWSTDSSSALFLSDGELHVYDADLGTIDTVDGFSSVVALGADPGAGRR
jgi:hypothetical protein